MVVSGGVTGIAMVFGHKGKSCVKTAASFLFSCTEVELGRFICVQPFEKGTHGPAVYYAGQHGVYGMSFRFMQGITEHVQRRKLVRKDDFVLTVYNEGVTGPVTFELKMLLFFKKILEHTPLLCF